MTFRILLLALAVTAVHGGLAGAQGASMTLGGYVDAYIAWDMGRPAARGRAFTTQAARHGEFAVNLAHIDLELSGDFVRGRLALQAGSSTTTTGVYGSLDTEPVAADRHLQEAVVGVRLGDRTWLDAGVFFSHTGSEKWITRDNLTYTRSLIADLSPYRLAGVKLSREVRPTIHATLVATNGWNQVTENNADKSVGLRADWRLTRSLTLAYYNLIGNEQPDTAESRARFYNGLTGTWAGSEFTITVTVDGGRQDTGGRISSWLGASLLARLQVMEHWAAHGRVESFQDPDGVIARAAAPFEVWGTSAGLDFEHSDGVTWRSEFRNLRGTNPVFEQFDGAARLSKFNYVFVTSLALSF